MDCLKILFIVIILILAEITIVYIMKMDRRKSYTTPNLKYSNKFTYRYLFHNDTINSFRNRVKLFSNSSISAQNFVDKILKRKNYSPITKNVHYIEVSETHLKISCFIVIQSHNRADNLIFLLNSLSLQPNISSCFLIISKDCDSPDINKIIKNIDFVPYIVLDYNLNHKVFTKEFLKYIQEILKNYIHILFPNDKQSISEDLQKIRPYLWSMLNNQLSSCEEYTEPNILIKILSLINLHLQNSIGSKNISNFELLHQLAMKSTTFDNIPKTLHHVPKKFSLNLIKHHWWSKLNSIFSPSKSLIVTIPFQPVYHAKQMHQTSAPKVEARLKDFAGPVLFLEEDYYVSPDCIEAMFPIYQKLYNNNHDLTSTNLSQSTILMYKWPIASKTNNNNVSMKLLPDEQEGKELDALQIGNLVKQYVALNMNFPRRDLSESPLLNAIWFERSFKLPIVSMGHYKDSVLTTLSPKALSVIDKYSEYIAQNNEMHKSSGLSQHAGTLLGLHHMAWWSGLHNMAMVFDRTLYSIIFGRAQARDAFCAHDDYNWDWTLGHLFTSILPQTVGKINGQVVRVEAVYPYLSRVYHMGLCGVHQKVKSPQEDDYALRHTTDSTSVCSIEANVRLLESNFKLLGLSLPVTNQPFVVDQSNLANKSNNIVNGDYNNNNNVRGSSATHHYNVNFLPRGTLNWVMGKPNGGWDRATNYDLCMEAAA